MFLPFGRCWQVGSPIRRGGGREGGGGRGREGEGGRGREGEGGGKDIEGGRGKECRREGRKEGLK